MTFAERLEELRKAATPGPWSRGLQKTTACLSGAKVFVDARGQNIYEKCTATERGDDDFNNSEFICFLANNADAILDLVRAADAVQRYPLLRSHIGSELDDRLRGAIAKLNGGQT